MKTIDVASIISASSGGTDKEQKVQAAYEEIAKAFLTTPKAYFVTMVWATSALVQVLRHEVNLLERLVTLIPDLDNSGPVGDLPTKLLSEAATHLQLGTARDRSIALQRVKEFLSDESVKKAAVRNGRLLQSADAARQKFTETLALLDTVHERGVTLADSWVYGPDSYETADLSVVACQRLLDNQQKSLTALIDGTKDGSAPINNLVTSLLNIQSSMEVLTAPQTQERVVDTQPDPSKRTSKMFPGCLASLLDGNTLSVSRDGVLVPAPEILGVGDKVYLDGLVLEVVSLAGDHAAITPTSPPFDFKPFCIGDALEEKFLELYGVVSDDLSNYEMIGPATGKFNPSIASESDRSSLLKLLGDRINFLNFIQSKLMSVPLVGNSATEKDVAFAVRQALLSLGLDRAVDMYERGGLVQMLSEGYAGGSYAQKVFSEVAKVGQSIPSLNTALDEADEKVTPLDTPESPNG